MRDFVVIQISLMNGLRSLNRLQSVSAMTELPTNTAIKVMNMQNVRHFKYVKLVCMYHWYVSHNLKICLIPIYFDNNRTF